MATTTTARTLPPKAGVKTAPIPPNQTLYVTNLPSAKINKADLKTALYMLFSTYGPVLDVVALKTMKMRGQAHIVFRDTQAATQAMRSLDGFQFLGKDLLPGTAPANVEMTETQQSIFNAPAPGSSVAPPTAPTTHGLPSKPLQSSDRAVADASGADSRGQKRPRNEEEEEDSDEDVAMEEDSDDE
ncbi:hypothetical protein F4775DRAFT_120508 [Biscogniauxia sp. FL1348]|nr:hypothetical protein F4775DRAFT_120508 [Biscogniauxia sp. FL1348]